VAGSPQGPVVERPLPEPVEREVVGCWVNPGWSDGLGLDQAPKWAASDPQGPGSRRSPEAVEQRQSTKSGSPSWTFSSMTNSAFPQVAAVGDVLRSPQAALAKPQVRGLGLGLSAV
jgi:hypothetical protein